MVWAVKFHSELNRAGGGRHARVNVLGANALVGRALGPVDGDLGAVEGGALAVGTLLSQGIRADVAQCAAQLAVDAE